MKKLLIGLHIFLLSTSITSATPVSSCDKDIKKLKDELYELESQIFYTKHLSPLITIRERTAFIICIAGVLGSFVAPFKFVKGSTTHPYRVLAKRIKIAGATLATSTAAACALTYMRPLLWLKENKKKRLEHKIFELQKTTTKI